MDNWPVQLRLPPRMTHSLHISNLIITERSILGRFIRIYSCEAQLRFPEKYEFGIFAASHHVSLLFFPAEFTGLYHFPATCLIYAFSAGTASSQSPLVKS
jgi:hypothetical protein